ncbi:hypothetical protein [Rhodopirellula sallentina]|uniref:Uncharacterized protein n=1 Tax=Rhodopirellula sallentina SM41 TaxID=1263870 RepID=M5U4N8_9BACT|nr:hypothetical protein [Rhodopirellula sallentina]EMI56214.1 hypothetical protein RSSM_02339 [Rhodopirellula sallentina SM41]
MWQIQTPTVDPKESPASGQSAEKSQLIGQWGQLIGQGDSESAGWTCRATGGKSGIAFEDPETGLTLCVDNVGSDPLPTSDEQYVCGDSWKIDYPQKTGEYRLRLSVRAVHTSPTRTVWEPTFSLQTSLLDTDPSLELTAVGRFDQELPPELPADVSVSSIRPADGNGQLLVLLGPLDAPFTKHRSSGNRLDLRIFGEFLEKGVIRKTRPWIIFDRTVDGVSPEEISRYCDELCSTPLPLTA